MFLFLRATSWCFHDEFDQPELDASKWKVVIDGHGGGNHESQYYTADSVSISTNPNSPTSGFKGLALTIRPIVNRGRQQRPRAVQLPLH